VKRYYGFSQKQLHAITEFRKSVTCEMNNFVTMRLNKTILILLLGFNTCGSPINAQPIIQPRYGYSLIRNNETDEYQSRRQAYFENGQFESMVFLSPTDSSEYRSYVYNGKLSPRLIDKTYFDRISLNVPTFDDQFICDLPWRFKWIQVRYITENWPGFKNIRTGESFNQNQQQFGGYLICAQDSGIFVSEGKGIAFIPYANIRNIRRGTSFGKWAATIFVTSLQSSMYNGLGELLFGLALIPPAALVYNIVGLSPNKVVRIYGDTQGKEFAYKVKSQAAYRNSGYGEEDFPLALVNIKNDKYNVVPRSILPQENIDSLERYADKIQTKSVPHYQDIQLAIYSPKMQSSPKADSSGVVTVRDPSIESITVGTPSTNATNAESPKGSTVNPFQQKQGEIPISWAIENFQPTEVSSQLFKSFPKTQKEILTATQLQQITNPNDIQMLAIYLMTGNGLDFGKLFQFTDEQIIKLNKTITVDAVYAQQESVLKVIDIPPLEYKNLSLLYERLMQLKN